MMSFKKSRLARPLAWVRGKVGSRSRRSVDVERRQPSVLSVDRGNPVANASSGASESQVARFITVHPRGDNTNATESAQSEPMIGPYSNPDDYRFVNGNGVVIEKAKSTGGVEILSPHRHAPVSDQKKHVDGASGLRRRTRNHGGATEETAGPSSRGNGNGASLNRNDDGMANHIGEEMAMVPVNQESTPTEAVKRPHYLRAFFDIMYFNGTSRRVPVDHRVRKDCSAVLQYIFILLVFFGMNLFSTWESFNQGKLYSLYFLSGQGMSFFMQCSYNIFCLLTKVYAAYRFTVLKDETDEMLQLIEEYDNEYDPQANCHCSHWKWIIFGMCVGTLIMSFAVALFERGILDWSLEVLGTEKSFEFSQDIHLWGYTDIINRNIELGQAYGGTDTYRVGYAVMSTSLTAVSNYQMGTLRDLALVSVFVIFVIVFALMKEVKETTENAPKDDIAACRKLQARREIIWKRYRKTKVVIAAYNVVFDTLFVFLHVDNLLLSGFFASLCIDVDRNDTGAFVYFNYLFNLVKAELTYLLAGRISAQNDVLQKWLRNWAWGKGKFVVDGEDCDLVAVLDELKKEPLAIGTGIFQINPEFHLKYLGFGGSLVLFLADEKKKN